MVKTRKGHAGARELLVLGRWVEISTLALGRLRYRETPWLTFSLSNTNAYGRESMESPMPLANRVLVCLRIIQEMSQEELARASGVSAKLISAYENGKKLSAERLAMFVKAMGLPGEVAEWMSSMVRSIRAVGRKAATAAEEEERRIETLAAQSANWTADFIRLLLSRTRVEADLMDVRHHAPSRLERLSRRSSRERALLLEECPQHRSWGIAELLCKKSLELAPSSPDQALQRAEFALEVAESLEEDSRWRSRVMGFALVHCANAKRVGGFPREAEVLFKKGKRLWEAGRGADPGIFDEALVFSLEASLRKELRELPEALRLAELALEADTGQIRRELLINKATILKHLGEYDQAIEILRQVLPLLEGEGHSRLLCIVEVNLAGTLALSGRFREAEEMLPRVRALVGALGEEISLMRLRWVEGQVAAAAGRTSAAIELFSGVRDYFARKGGSYDTALVTLELAGVYLEAGRAAGVKRLARELAPVFQSEGLHREALAAVRLFCSAVEQETVTAELARQIVVYLYRAECNPRLVFGEGCGDERGSSFVCAPEILRESS